ncbi:hypothetical protein I6F53_18855 [Pseudoalteromonas sp. SWN29]|uniref:hypothetical protein n=1 Tax=Pseudoalteromonas sp. SWN29 TaxID=2792064 RepID=UPI0018CDC282|nr:hypothetical protein [Pseudoalteromonas sp. SWN29]MBH0029026.1 hypothetical protein [Pseudoalteromonas sp. SWN29]
MKNLKPLLFSTLSELKKSSSSIKNSHLYEAFAAFCGFKSYAALQAAPEFYVNDFEQSKIQCFNRMKQMGFSNAESLQIYQNIKLVWEQYNNISLEDIYTFYSEASYEDILKSKHTLDALMLLVESGNKEAIFISLIFTTQVLAKYKDNPDNRSGKFWYKKKLANENLNQFQLNIAEQFQQIASYNKLFELLLKKFEASNKKAFPSPAILKVISKYFDDGVKRCWSSYFSAKPYLVIDSIFYVLDYYNSDIPIIPSHIYQDWLKAEMLTSHSHENLVEIIELSNNNDEKWLWYFVGLELGLDATQSNLRAINANTGKDYDDYGPMDVIGNEGVCLPAISDKRKIQLKSEAIKLIS